MPRPGLSHRNGRVPGNSFPGSQPDFGGHYRIISYFIMAYFTIRANNLNESDGNVVAMSWKLLYSLSQLGVGLRQLADISKSPVLAVELKYALKKDCSFRIRICLEQREKLKFRLPELTMKLLSGAAMRTIIKSKRAQNDPKKEFIISSPEAALTEMLEASGERTSFIGGISNEERHHLIAEAAYFRAERRSFAPGHELEDWLGAEAEVDTKLIQKGADPMRKQV